MISVTIHRKTLEKHEACKAGLALYDAIAAMLPESDARRDRRIRIANWTPLHSIWAYAAGYGAFAQWLEVRGIIPHADLSRAHLYGAYLYGVNLSGANLSRANLSRADLSRANLYGVNLYGANLYGANFYGANLSGAYRGSSSPIPGWRTLATGYVERETASTEAAQ